MLLPRVISRLTDSGETVRMLKNPPLVVGHRYLVESLRRGTFSGALAAFDKDRLTVDLDRGECLTLARVGLVLKDITEDGESSVERTEPTPGRVADLTGRGPGY